ncbi:PH, RCC1 and FYVE domains-containing protein 1-like [Wolffia australiana]
MQGKGSSSDLVRVSVSSAPSSSSHGSTHEDSSDAACDVYIWGEVISCKSSQPLTSRADILLPRLLESTRSLDAFQVACGVRHAALVTKGGEIFTWGEESGGCLGHGSRTDCPYPQLVDFLAFTSVDFVSCGEFHTCAVTTAGELFTWGDGRHGAGLLGHGSNVSHWIPKRVSRSLDKLHVAHVSCGTWHTAVITSAGQLFTFGDGTFGVLGHGNRESVAYPREVESLTGLKTISVACGVWHTAAVVEVIVAQQSISVCSGKLFTWGDGDKHRLGHGDRESKLKPTCIPSLIDHNFLKVACGHSLTVGLTMSGQVFSMGSTVYGQLGNPYSDGKLPCLVEDQLRGESVSEVACGAYHVAVLTLKGEVFTWGKGASGRLGHGDVEDRKTPTLVEALKDRTIRRIACGANFTAAICLHKWVSGSEQPQCSACRQAFGFTRKRHNCYNCGLVHCHSCSSRKAFGAALSPNPSKPYRVCDTCYLKLGKISDAKKVAPPRPSNEKELKYSKSFLPGNLDLIKSVDSKTAKPYTKKFDSLMLLRTTEVFGLAQFKDFDLRLPFVSPKSVSNSRAASPFSRRSSPPRSATPVPTMSGLAVYKNGPDSLKKTNDVLSREVLKLRAQVDNLRQRCERQEFELQKATKKAQEAMAMAAEESAKCQAAKEVIKSLTSELKNMAEKLPLGSAYDGESKTRSAQCIPNGETAINSNGSTSRNSNKTSDSDAQTTNKPGSVQKPAVEANGEEDSGRRDQDEPTNPTSIAARPPIEAEWIEQCEPGVYITLVALRDGSRDLKRVRFSRRRFGEHQAEAWWLENRHRVYQRYNVRGLERPPLPS